MEERQSGTEGLWKRMIIHVCWVRETGKVLMHVWGLQCDHHIHCPSVLQTPFGRATSVSLLRAAGRGLTGKRMSPMRVRRRTRSLWAPTSSGSPWVRMAVSLALASSGRRRRGPSPVAEWASWSGAISSPGDSIAVVAAVAGSRMVTLTFSSVWVTVILMSSAGHMAVPNGMMIRVWHCVQVSALTWIWRHCCFYSCYCCC